MRTPPPRHVRLPGLVGLLLTASCASAPVGENTLRRDFVAARAPVLRWARPAPGPAKHRDGVELTDLSIETETGGRVTIRSPRLDIVVTGRPELSTGRRTIDRGFMTQFEFDGAGLDRHIEVFRGSPIVSIFQRTDLQTKAELTGYRLELNTPLDRMLAFDRNEAVEGEARTRVLAPGETSKPFVIFHDIADTRGVVLYLPHAPELRTWYSEDFVVSGRASARITPRRGTRTMAIEVEFERHSGGARGRRSFDAPLFLMPYEGRAQDALDALRLGELDLLDPRAPIADAADGYWAERPSGQRGEKGGSRLFAMTRYAPREFVSWPPKKPIARGHAEGHAWGVTTQAMKDIRAQPASPRALARDHSWRLLTFFLEAGAPKGAPPNLHFVPSWAERLPKPEHVYEVVFCQFWEFRVNELIAWVESPWLRATERERILEDVERARRVFDPSGPYTWTSTTPNGGYWFDYFDEPLDGRNVWIINTHATSTVVAGQLQTFAETLGASEAASWWRDVFRRGALGLLWASDQAWMWTDADSNELAYGRYSPGPRTYHTHMLEAWLPRIVEHARVHTPELSERLLAFWDRALRAKFLDDKPEQLAKLRAARRQAEVAASKSAPRKD